MTSTPNVITSGCGYAGELRSLAATFAALGVQVETSTTKSTLESIVAMVLDRIPAAAASITILRRGRFQTGASTSQQAAQADALQYQLHSGPCVDAIVENTAFHSEDLATDQRWPQFGPRVVVEHGFASMLSYRLGFEVPVPGDLPADGQETLASLNIYGDTPGAFSEADEALGLLLATHAAIALIAANGWERSRQLREALDSSRDIGVALGVLMSQNKVTRDQAFDLLRIASQNRNRKLHHLALEVADTGTLEFGTDHAASTRARFSEAEVSNASAPISEADVG